MKQAGENSNSLKMVFRNRPENEKIVRTTAAVFASVLDPTLEEISDFKTAVSEAVTNAIIHAYPKTGGDIEAYFKREDKSTYNRLWYRYKRCRKIDAAIVFNPTYTGTFRDGLYLYGSIRR